MKEGGGDGRGGGTCLFGRNKYNTDTCLNNSVGALCRYHGNHPRITAHNSVPEKV